MEALIVDFNKETMDNLMAETTTGIKRMLKLLNLDLLMNY